MPLSNTPIQRKLMTILLLTSGLVLLVTSASFVAYEFVAFRQTAVRQLNTLGEIIASNSTAALAFDNPDDARETLSALKAERHVVAATLYDRSGTPFATYPGGGRDSSPPAPGPDGYRFESSRLIGFQPVVQGDRRLGTLYLEEDMGAMYERLQLYGGIALLVIAGSLLLAYLLSRKLQGQISRPILALAETAKAVSDRRDYSVRAPRTADDELGLLTDAFNHMLGQIHQQHQRHFLLNGITRSIGERLDLASIFAVVIRNLEDNLPIDFGCICLYDPEATTLTVTGLGQKGRVLALAMGMEPETRLPIDQNGLSRCVGGQLVYEPDVSQLDFAFPRRLAAQGLRSLIAAPLLVESQVFGVLIAARREEQSFTSPDCEFVRQLSEHVGLAAHQAQTNAALQQAYDDLRQSQQTVLQQERLRALGQMASGIAHDINNAISPVVLYTQSLLENEPGLSPRARDYLETIERAVDDVAATVARMREFYRQRAPQLVLEPTSLNDLVHQVLSLTRARWTDMPQQRGVVIEARTELAPELPQVMAAESEVREALTNLVFNAVDAMPEGGTLTIRTRTEEPPSNGDGSVMRRQVHVEVADTGLGMDEEARRRCLEPFFTTKGERGTGLGLSMVYGMAQRHSADIQIESGLGLGTTVRLSFVAPTGIERPAAGAPVSAQPPRLRLLLVDDDPMLLKSLRNTLETDGHDVVGVNGGQQGIDTFQKAVGEGQAFDVVITDLGMPYIDGRQVARGIKRASPSTAVILLTGWGQRLLSEGDIPPDVDLVLSKPPKLRDLREALIRCVELAGS